MTIDVPILGISSAAPSVVIILSVIVWVLLKVFAWLREILRG